VVIIKKLRFSAWAICAKLTRNLKKFMREIRRIHEAFPSIGSIFMNCYLAKKRFYNRGHEDHEGKVWHCWLAQQ
jgi:hypothetical protein